MLKLSSERETVKGVGVVGGGEMIMLVNYMTTCDHSERWYNNSITTQDRYRGIREL